MTPDPPKLPESSWRSRWHEIIFEAETPLGKTFDVGLIVLIIASIIVVLAESVTSIREEHGVLLYRLEWAFTSVFTIEYVLRLMTVRKPMRYALSFFGLVDLLSILPTFASLLFPGTQSLLTIRSLRLLRVFRVLKLSSYLGEAQHLMGALRASRKKISVFLFAVVSLTVIIGSIMYVIEGEDSGFNDIPTAIYWSIVTLTTVGYGDVTPITPLGKMFASMVMIMGYGIIAVPTGIVTAELARSPVEPSTESCPSCSAEGHDRDARHCKFCGVAL